MKRIVSVVVCLAVIVVFQQSSAQDYAFKVLVNKGKNEIRKGNEWQPLKVGSSLASLDELKVSENAYVGLVHVSGKPYEVKKAGKYKVADLSAKVGTGASVLHKYTDFVLSSNDPAKNNLTATGAVHRGPNTLEIYLPAPEKAYFYNDSVTIQWAEAKAPYTVVITNLFGDVLLKTESKTNFIDINFADKRFANENEYEIRVESADKKIGENYTIRRLPAADKTRLSPIVNDIKSGAGDTSALGKIVQAGGYENNNLLIDAATAFHKAFKLEPALKENYEFFLYRNKLKTPPKK